MKIRMAMNKLKQALGLEITDEQLLQILKNDADNADIGNDQHLVPYFEPSPDSGDLQDYADLVQELQGRGLY
tara:strand:+ start:996 stop:1211 length:216 start_codon:yes stop_codon:yes gene_type:complete